MIPKLGGVGGRVGLQKGVSGGVSGGVNDQNFGAGCRHGSRAQMKGPKVQGKPQPWGAAIARAMTWQR
ncbi:hypothetical protein PROH_06995 [Prochlorothrix hollandica PCC 9006 = CALU 1027]|uniref:Uncharacterized protein n=1 Tax=Prochlorothrix hollandica PCC 9006 = CALU 1027 TaxID=317619 RepID=A0A0M2PZ18_PROHO|nr:hypothetical protein PROH_06995 [Prochlorothrix hollandica PCC 9006 = CALU 1027]